jgi:hypothetical protein
MMISLDGVAVVLWLVIGFGYYWQAVTTHTDNTGEKGQDK